jgi:prepilin-type N-terminal cleavage/methylation domain-containing protein
MPTSRSGFPDPRRAGFTLVELVVVIVALGLIVVAYAAMVVPTRNRAHANMLLQNGSRFTKELIATHFSGSGTQWMDIFPQSARTNSYASSTEYFKYQLELDELFNVDFSTFGGAGASLSDGSDPAQFTSMNNAWNVVLDALTAGNDYTPFLITRNLVLPGNRLPDGTLREKGENLAALLKSTPDRLLSISRDYLVVVTRSASGNAVHAAKDLGRGKAHLLNPTAHRLPVLRP